MKILNVIKEVNLIPERDELSETTDFVYNFVQKPYASEQLRCHI